MLIIKEKGEKKMRRKLIAGSLAAMTLLSVPVYASGAEGGESKYQTCLIVQTHRKEAQFWKTDGQSMHRMLWQKSALILSL